MPINRISHLLIGIISLTTCWVFSQDQKLADSLIARYQSGSYGEHELELIRDIAENEQNPDRKIEYSELLIHKAELDSLYEFLISGYLQKGNALKLKGNVVPALNAYIKSLNYAHDIDDEQGIGVLSIAIADTYSTIGNSKNAMSYYKNAIVLFRRLKDSIELASALLNAGDEYFNTANYDSALAYFEESGLIFKKLDYFNGTAYNLGNTGMVYAEQGRDKLAEYNINEAITMLEELEDYYSISIYLTYMADIYTRRLDFNTAFSYLHRSLALAELYGLKDQISDANLKLSVLYEEFGDYENSHNYFKQHIAYRDSVNNLGAVQQMADQRTNYEVSQKQIEVDLLDQKHKNKSNIAIATAVALFLIGLLAIGLFRRNTFIRKTKQIIEKERDRSDTLLLNILPQETAQELKEHGSVKAKKYDEVTVMFTDFKGFTSFSEKLSPEDLVETVNFYFSKFDAIIEKHGLEKIKTIGDAYMCAGGLHGSEINHPKKMVLAATEIAQFVYDTKQDKDTSTMNFDVRIGINTGPVVAGVVGTKKFAYDIWGDTVNVASRMESMSEPGKINISNSTFELIKPDFDCDYRGEIEAKNRGKIKMYFVKAAKSEVLSNVNG